MTELGSFLAGVTGLLDDAVDETIDLARERSNRRGFTITKLQRDEHGHWTARITNGQTYEATRRSGSWTTVPDEDGRCREILPGVAAALQAKVRPLEAAERRAKKDAEPASESVTLG